MIHTWYSIHKGIKECHYKVDKYSTVKEYVAPQRHVGTDPKQEWLT
jgi:hypothetical protein